VRISDLFCCWFCCCCSCRSLPAAIEDMVSRVWQRECFLGPLLEDVDCAPLNGPPGRGIAFPRARNLAFMFVRYLFSMALWAAFLRFITAAASGPLVAAERADLLFLDDAVVNFGEASGEEEEDEKEASEALRAFSLVGLAGSLGNNGGDSSLISGFLPMTSTGD
jgi:hypothetical protein